VSKSIIERMLDEGIVPIMSEEGINSLFNYILECYKNGDTFRVATSPSREIKLSNYKKPNDDIESYDSDVSCMSNICQYLLQSIEKDYLRNGFEFVKNELVNLRLDLSEKDLQTPFNYSYDEIENAIREGNIETLPPLIQKMYSASMVFGDKVCGSYDNVPYRCEHESSYSEDYRIYINSCSGVKRNEFLEIYAKKCIDKKIPFEMKGRNKTDVDNKAQDRTVLYIHEEYLDSTLKILEEIKKENPELIDNFGSPITTGCNYSYYAVSSRGKRSATYNMFFDRLSQNAFNCTISNLIIKDTRFFESLSKQQKEDIKRTADIKNYEESLNKPGSLGIMRALPISDVVASYLKNANAEELITSENMSRFKDTFKKMSSYTNFGDYEHTKYPVCFNNELYEKIEKSKSKENVSEVKSNTNVDDLTTYLYNTEQLFAGALQEFSESTLPSKDKAINYINRVKEIEAKYRYYAVHTPGFVGTDRYKEVHEHLKTVPRFEHYQPDLTKGNGINMVLANRYYEEVSNTINTHISEISKKNSETK